eukprot:jgi/Astpho2/7487/e_gw1.00114.155.1_t
MLLLPRWPITHRLMKGYAVFLPLSAIYIVLLARSWTPDMLQLMMPGSGFRPQFFPSLEGIATLFSRVTTAASLWVHLLAINLFAARSAYLEGLQKQVPFFHSVLLCTVFGPLGLLSHCLTQAVKTPAKPVSSQAV